MTGGSGDAMQKGGQNVVLNFRPPLSDMQNISLDALKPFLHAAAATTSPHAAADLIMQAVSAEETFIFAELLNHDNIQTLLKGSPEHTAFLELLQVFSHGTYEDYQKSPQLPELNESQMQKLLQLSLISLCDSPELLTYSHIQSSLCLPNSETVEELVMSAIWANLMTAKLDPLAGKVRVSAVAPIRSVKPEIMPGMISDLKEWHSRCVRSADHLKGEIDAIHRRARERIQNQEAERRALEKAAAEEEARWKQGTSTASGVGTVVGQADINSAKMGDRNIPGPSVKSMGKRTVGDQEEQDEMELDNDTTGGARCTATSSFNTSNTGRVTRNAKRHANTLKS